MPIFLRTKQLVCIVTSMILTLGSTNAFNLHFICSCLSLWLFAPDVISVTFRMTFKQTEQVSWHISYGKILRGISALSESI